jgi:hypothetical protein
LAGFATAFAAGFEAAEGFGAGAGCAFWTAAFFDSGALFTAVFVDATGF